MAIIDKEKGLVILRIVYAGPPMSGKTTSMRSLSELLFDSIQVNEAFYSPDETNERTLYFDWLQYIGGYFQGYKVCCQLISVPSSKNLKSRQKMLLEMADVVVLVIDSKIAKLNPMIKYYHEMISWLERKHEPPVGVVVQANMRDKANVASIDYIHYKFDDPKLRIFESVAIEKTGIREVFVYAVRIGLKRATWLMEHDQIVLGTADLESGQDLLDFILKAEANE